MFEKILYYINLFSELCGFDGSEGGAVFGWVVVLFSTLIVIAAFYVWITRSLWPGEEDENHIKRRILIEDEVPHAH